MKGKQSADGGSEGGARKKKYFDVNHVTIHRNVVLCPSHGDKPPRVGWKENEGKIHFVCVNTEE